MPAKHLTPRPCSIPGCERVHESHGYCARHADNLRKYSDPLYYHHSWPERFWRKVDKSGDCWLWTGAISKGIYGRASDPNGKVQLAHRVAYELCVGPIPAGLHLDHLCRVTACVNPAHLEPVTQKVNNQRAFAKDTCLRGHDLTNPANLYQCKDYRPHCRECQRIRSARYYQERKARRAA